MKTIFLLIELEYLKKTSSKDKVTNFEKIFLLMNKPYKGHYYLEKVYDNEVSAFLKNLNLIRTQIQYLVKLFCHI